MFLSDVRCVPVRCQMFQVSSGFLKFLCSFANQVLQKLDELVPAVAYYLRALGVDGTACAAAWLKDG